MSNFDALGQSKSKGTIALSDKQIVVGVYLLNGEKEDKADRVSMSQLDGLLGWEGYGPEGKTSKSQVLINQVKNKHKNGKSIDSHTGGLDADTLKAIGTRFLAEANGEEVEEEIEETVEVEDNITVNIQDSSEEETVEDNEETQEAQPA